MRLDSTEACFSWLRERGYDENDPHKTVPVVMKGFRTEWTAMAAACEAGALGVCAWLHAREVPGERVALARAPDAFGSTPLFLACGRGHVAVCEWLWAHGAADDARAPNALGFTPMAVGLASGELGACAWLVRRGALNEPDDARDGAAAPGHVSRALVEQATRKGNKAHVRSLLAWSRGQLAAHALFLRVLHQCARLRGHDGAAHRIAEFAGVDGGRALRNVREFSEVLAEV